MTSINDKWYVGQVLAGKEASTLSQCRKLIDPSILHESFVPEFETMWKSSVGWRPERRLLFPGYLFFVTGNIEALAVAYGNAEMIVDANPDLVICTWEFDVKAEYSANVIMMQKGETELLDAVNAILAQAKEANLYDGWYKDAVELGKSENAQELTLG